MEWHKGNQNQFRYFTENLREQIPTIRRELKAFGEGAREWFQPVMESGAWCMDHQEVVKGTIAGISGAPVDV